MNELALFAGAGGGILGGKLLGWRTVCAVEWEQYPACVLAARQNDGLLPPFPIWDDVQTFDGKPWRGIVDVVSGGFPCQDISVAGRGGGITGSRSSMWKQMARIIGEVQPKYCFVENSPMLTSRGLGVVLGDLASLGFDAEWGVLSAADVGANHLRERIWIVARNMADPKKLLCNGSNNNPKISMEREKKPKLRNNSWAENVSDSSSEGLQGCSKNGEAHYKVWKNSELWSATAKCGWWEFEPDVGRVANGVAARVDRLKALGNGQVPLCAATAWKLLNDRFI
jgi:DNA (cytosine-5)-methyltransferase 1